MTADDTVQRIYNECHEDVTRKGESQPCERPAVALRYDPEERNPYPVCVGHTRHDMVPLAAGLVVPAPPVDGERMYTASEVADYQTSEAELVSRPLRRRLDRAETDLAAALELATKNGEAASEYYGTLLDARQQLDQVRKLVEHKKRTGRGLASELLAILDAAPADETGGA